MIILNYKTVDLTGRRFTKLVVIKSTENRLGANQKWRCLCDCGNEVDVLGYYLLSTHTKTCGWCQKYSDCGEYMVCTVASGRKFLFDKDDLLKVIKHRWYVDDSGYVLSLKHLRLHRCLVDAPKGTVVDHKNGDPSDCRRNNLRITTQKHNVHNSGIRTDNTSGFKGVSYAKREKRYRAYIRPFGYQKSLGYYDTPEDAARAYNRAALLYFGEFARLNEIKETENERTQTILELVSA